MRNSKKQHNLSTFFVQSIDIDPISKNYAKVKGVELFLEPKTPKAKRCISIPDFLYDDIHKYMSKL